MMKKYFLPCLLLLLGFLSGCNATHKNKDLDPAPKPIVNDILEVRINADDARMPAGFGTMMNVTVINKNHEIEDVSKKIHWTISNDEAVDVDASISIFADEAQVTAKKAGKATVTAEYKGVKGSIELEVTDAKVTNLVVSPGINTVSVGYIAIFTAMAGLDDGSSFDVSAYSTWASNDPDIISFFLINNSAAFFTANNPGVTTISATTPNGISAVARVDVSAATAVNLTVTPYMSSAPKGQDVQFRAIVEYADHEKRDVTGQVTWTSANKEIANFVPGTAFHKFKGVLSTLSPGNTSIQASLPDIKSDPVSLTVNEAILDHIEVNAASDSLPEGATQQYTAQAVYSDDTSYLITNNPNLVWLSSDNVKATISDDGWVNTKAEGDVDISATFSRVSGKKALTITQATMTGLTLTWPNSQGQEVLDADSRIFTKHFIAKNSSVPLMAIASYTNGQQVDISHNWRHMHWKSSNILMGFTVSNHLYGIGDGLVLVDTSLPIGETIEASFNDKDGTGEKFTAKVAFLSTISSIMPGPDDSHLEYFAPLTWDEANTSDTDMIADPSPLDEEGVSPRSFARQTWTQAQQFCNSVDYDGKNNWRLPTQDELQAVVESYDVTNPDNNWIIAEQFHWYTKGNVWSSTPGTDDNTHLATSLRTGEASMQKDDNPEYGYTTCVRSIPLELSASAP